MWNFDEDGVHLQLDVSQQITKEHLDADLSSSALSLSDSEQSDSNSTHGKLSPLSCLCSQSTLGSHSSSCLEDEPNISKASMSGQLSCDEVYSGKHVARQIIKGAFIGWALSVFLVAFCVHFASDSSIKLANVINFQIGGKKFDQQIAPVTEDKPQKLHERNRRQRQLRDNRPRSLSDYKDTHLYSLHDTRLDGELIRQFFDRTHKAIVYHSNDTSRSAWSNHHSRRKLQSSSKSDATSSDDDSKKTTIITRPKDPQLVVAGKLTVADGPCNVAQMNLKTGEWSLQQRIQLSLYNSYSGGEVYSLLANHTIAINSNAKEYRAEETSSKGRCV